jgi:O-acetyl-ADP-ribose deacetylase (regulator of RNase III)
VVKYTFHVEEMLGGDADVWSEILRGWTLRRVVKRGSRLACSLVEEVPEFGFMLPDQALDDDEILECDARFIQQAEFERMWDLASVSHVGSLELEYLVGDATDFIAKPGIIAHICNDIGKWGRGFVLAVSRKWKAPEARYRDAAEAGRLRLGEIECVEVDEWGWVANMVAQRGIRSRTQRGPAVDYGALEQCLTKLRLFAQLQRAAIQMPRIGAGLGGGDWNVIEHLIIKTLRRKGVLVRVVDAPK